jgi:hypothetical protein
MCTVRGAAAKPAPMPSSTRSSSPSLRSGRARSPMAPKVAKAQAGKKQPSKPAIPPRSPDLRRKKQQAAFAKTVQAEATLKVQSTIAKAKQKQDANDEKIASAKRAIQEARRKSGTVYGDVSAYARKYAIKVRELRTALEARGRAVRSKRGRPPNIQESQSHFIVGEVESRACRSRSMTKIAVGAALGAIAASNSTPFSSQSGSSSNPSKRTMGRFCKQRGLFTVTVNETEKARLDGVSKKKIDAFFARYKTNVLDKNPLLRERRRHGNLDETPVGGRGEKLNRRLCALVTKNVMRKKKGASIRTEAISDGPEGMSYLPFTLADSTVLAKIFIVAADKISPKWLAPPPQHLKCCHEFLPRMPLDYFEKGDVAVYCTASGVMTTAVFEKMIQEVIVPQWRKIVPTGPLCLHMDAPESHAMSRELAQFLKANEVICNFFPHKTSTVLQPLDLWFNMKWRAKFREYVDALITVGQNTHAYLDDRLQAQFMQRK